ncbi:hypothetical protein CDCA_CDCA17G4354 [Cyanidium caldarium]|uniref:Fringe-like glycosyltransferase domain-containing protein n=1 Tax=Cyanidium caldarium TaxID=2771 RepID=A0AAV9J1A2_CYACA|nr:hypothetical protein CDCA_CDCA17G4354 [Cyanidium caldarium]
MRVDRQHPSRHLYGVLEDKSLTLPMLYGDRAQVRLFQRLPRRALAVLSRHLLLFWLAAAFCGLGLTFAATQLLSGLLGSIARLPQTRVASVPPAGGSIADTGTLPPVAGAAVPYGLPQHYPSCSQDLLILIRTSKKTYSHRAPNIIWTWMRDFPRERMIFVSADELPDLGHRIMVLDVLRTDPYYGHTYSPDAVGAPVFLKEMQRLNASSLFIVDDDTFVFGENLCHTIQQLRQHQKDRFLYAGFSFCMDKPYGALMSSRCIQLPEAPRAPPAHRRCSVGFAYGGGGVLMNRELVEALASVAEQCWDETYCIRGGSLRTWWCMYFHPEIFHGKEQRMDMHFAFFPNRPAYYLQNMRKDGKVQTLPYDSSVRPATFHHVEGAEAFWLYSLRLAPTRHFHTMPKDWKGEVTVRHVFKYPPPWTRDCQASVFVDGKKVAVRPAVNETVELADRDQLLRG